MSHDFSASVADNSVSVHVRLSAGASLPDYKWEVVCELALDDFIGSFDDGVSDLRVKTELDV